MLNRALHKVADLSFDARREMEGIVGRPLNDDEAVAVSVYQPAPVGSAREEASRRLRENIDNIARRAAHASEAEIDAAINEASDRVRHHPE